MNNIEEILPVTKPYIELYSDTNKIGTEFLSKQNVIFAALVRDVGSVINKNINKIVNFANKYCKSYKIVLYENDSVDNTKIELDKICSNNDNIHYISEKFNRPKFGPVKDKVRTITLAQYRNTLKDFIKNKFDNVDFVIVIDMDFIDLSENGLLNSFGWLAQYSHMSAMAGNSFQLRKIFDKPHEIWNYDSWAYRGSWWEDTTKFKNSDYQHVDSMLWFGLWLPPVGSIPFIVNSAFGGSCIYRPEYYFSGTYDGKDCEHVTFHYHLYDTTNFKLFLNPSQIMLLS